MDGAYLEFKRHGAARHGRVALSILDDLAAVLAACPSGQAGVRLHGVVGLAPLLVGGSPIGRIAAARLGPVACPVRAILFDKTPGENWSLGWHQDRTVAVRMRHDLLGYGPWSMKAGAQHVEPPFSVIEGMVTLRVHLDDVPTDNAPLLVAPGSHRLGRIPETAIGSVVEQCGAMTCLARRGDIWCYATSILHSSASSTGHAHRRVLQVDYAARSLDPPLEWLGV